MLEMLERYFLVFLEIGLPTEKSNIVFKKVGFWGLSWLFSCPECGQSLERYRACRRDTEKTLAIEDINTDSFFNRKRGFPPRALPLIQKCKCGHVTMVTSISGEFGSEICFVHAFEEGNLKLLSRNETSPVGF
jgi:hypothetical protein